MTPAGAGPAPALIASTRQAVGLTQAEAAELVYVSPHTWRSWECAAGAARARPMPLGLWELFRIKTARIEPRH